MQLSYPTLLTEFEQFKKQTEHRSFLVAFSGGLDSTVLLHLLAHDAELHARTRALYVDHQIQSESAVWGLHCEKVCHNWAIPFQSIQVTLGTEHRQGLEARARKARYSALYKALLPDTLLLTAHHQRDQVETFLLNLTRGSGVAGLAAMPYQKSMTVQNHKKTDHIRPLLRVPYQELVAYADHFMLDWVEDPSNLDHRYARNLVRNQLLPQFEQACPNIQSQIAKSAEYQAEAFGLLDRLAEQDLKRGVFNVHCITLSSYAELDWPSLKNVLRYWGKTLLNVQFSADHLEWIKLYGCDQCSATASLKMRSGSLRFYRDNLYYVVDSYNNYSFNLSEFKAQLSDQSKGASRLEEHFETRQFDLTLPHLWVHEYKDRLTVRNLREGEPFNRQKAKKWFQEQGVPTWQRGFWPVLFLDETPLFLCGADIKKGWLSPELVDRYQAQLMHNDAGSEKVSYRFTEHDVVSFFQDEHVKIKSI
ncbi:MAG: tRNA lysidine(34) synthetase TilS [Thiotrichales bacterium]|nr:tRNA lysidine(34) synthetase TilS [Thiotrichales bacterium]